MYLIRGFGFIVPSEDIILEFVRKHEKTFYQIENNRELIDKLLNSGNEDCLYRNDLMANYSCLQSGHSGSGAFISNIMTKETGINFEFQSGDDYVNSEPTILFPEKLPWEYTEKERNLTETVLRKIIENYVKELHLDSNYINYYEIEYGR